MTSLWQGRVGGVRVFAHHYHFTIPRRPLLHHSPQSGSGTTKPAVIKNNGSATSLRWAASSAPNAVEQGLSSAEPNKARYRYWTQHELNTLFDMHQRGVARAEIAKVLNRTCTSVNQRLFSGQGPTKKVMLTSEELDQVKILYQQGMSKSQVATTLQQSYHRVCQALSSTQGSSSAMKRGQAIPFTEAEDMKLKSLRASGQSWPAIANQIPGRRPSTLFIRHRILTSNNGCEYRPDKAGLAWTDTEKDLMIELHSQGVTHPEIVRILKRPVGSIGAQLFERKPDYKRKRRPWTSEEDNMLMSLKDEGKSKAQIVSNLGSHRTQGAVKARYIELKRRADNLHSDQKALESPARHGIPSLPTASGFLRGTRGYATQAKNYTPRVNKYWTKEEDETLRRMKEEGCPTAHIASTLDRTSRSVIHRYHRLCTSRDITATHKRFTQQDLDKLVQLRDSDMKWEQISAEFPGRMLRTLKNRYFIAKRSSTSATQHRSDHWTTEDEEKLIEYRNRGLSEMETACAMNRSMHSIRDRISKIFRQTSQGQNSHLPALDRRNQRWTTAESDTVYRMRAASKSYAEIASMLNTPRTVRAIKTHHYKLRHLMEKT